MAQPKQRAHLPGNTGGERDPGHNLGSAQAKAVLPKAAESPRTAEPTSVQGSEQIYRHKFGMPIKLKT
jgi:hypothetical protein